MGLFWEGIQVGLILSFLMGPIFFVLVQTSVEQGFRAGAAVGLGIWVSDVLFFLAVFYGLRYVKMVVAWPQFPFVLGLAGSIILVLFGLGAFFVRPSMDYFESPVTRRVSTWPNLFMKGFLVNTINPFSVFFWMGLMSTVILKNAMHGKEPRMYAAGIIGMVIATDLLKVILAKRIRQLLKPRHLLWFRRISGAALILFGLALFIRSFWGEMPG